MILLIIHVFKMNSTRYLGDNCIVFDNFTASIGDLMVANWVYWRRDMKSCA